MKRIGSSDSFGALISMCPTTEDDTPRKKLIYSRDQYEAMLDEMEESGYVAEKKRRLSVDQVKALEKNFEVDNKLEPERKVKLAQELGLQPRQVAVWFQNRRARWKTKQLERDYGTLKANFDSLKHNYDSLRHDNQALLNEIKELKSQLNEENTEKNLAIKEEGLVLESDTDNNNRNHKATTEPITHPTALTAGSEDANLKGKTGTEPALVAEFKDRQSDSDSSAILNDDHSPNASNSSSGVLQNHKVLMSPHSSCFSLYSSSSSPTSINCFSIGSEQHNNVYHPQFVKMEEHNFLGVELACNLFSEDQAPTLSWYCADLI